MRTNTFAAVALASTIGSLQTALAAPAYGPKDLSVQLSVADGLLNSSINGRILVLFAPAGTDPLEDTDVTSSPDLFFGKNVYRFDGGDISTLSGGDGVQPRTDVYGFPNVSLSDVAAGDYSVQAYLNVYTTAHRSDGSTVSVRFPQGDGQLPEAGPGSLITEIQNFTISGGAQTIKLTFDSIVPVEEFNGTEIGGPSQGNYVDTDFVKYVKIRSTVLSNFWNRDMYVGATVLLPAGYNTSSATTRYPVICKSSPVW